MSSKQKKRTKKSRNEKKSPWFGIIAIVLLVIAVFFLLKFGTEIINDYQTAYNSNDGSYERFMNLTAEDFTIENLLNELEERLSPSEPSAKPTVSNDFSTHALEIPVCKGTLAGEQGYEDHEIHTYSGFTLCYRESYEVAEWVAYSLTKEELNAVTGRTDNFKSDPSISTGSATLSDYRSSGYDRGHLAPAADMEWSLESVDDSFLMSNMTPQAPEFNRGMWKSLEDQVRDWADAFGEVFVVTGPVLEKTAESYSTIGKNAVCIPEYFYKVLMAFDESGNNKTAYAIAFILPNSKCTGTIWDYQVTVDEVESRTGIDFFNIIDDLIEDKIESSLDNEFWK